MNRWSLQYSYHLVVFIITKLSYIVAKAVVIEVYAIDLFFFCVLQTTKTSEHNTKIGCTSFLCVYMCVLFFFFFSWCSSTSSSSSSSASTSASASSCSSLFYYHARSLCFCYYYHHHKFTQSFIHSFTHYCVFLFTSSYQPTNKNNK
jgi:hypothetical protein